MSLFTNLRTSSEQGVLSELSNDLASWTTDHPLNITGDFTQATRFYLPFFQRSRQFAVLYWHFYARGEPEPRSKLMMGILPQLHVPVLMDLSWVNGLRVFMPRTPGRLKGTLIGRGVEPEELDRIEVTLQPSITEMQCEASAVVVLGDGEEPPALDGKIMCDRFGQWVCWDWPEKVHSEEELKACLDGFESLSPRPMVNYSRYGGWTEKRFAATGFFYSHQEEGVWWLVDPEGYAFYSAGLDCIRDSIGSAIVPGTEHLYEDLDQLTTREWNAGSAWPTRHVDHLGNNFDRHWGAERKPRWRRAVANHMKDWGFNTVGNWSDVKVGRAHQIPYVLNMPNYPSTEIDLFRELPDVYDPIFEKNATEWAAYLNDYAEDPLMIGYFMTNEPKWGFGEFNLAAEMLERHPGTYSRQAFAAFLKEKYQDDKALSEAWGGRVSGFDDIVNKEHRRVADGCEIAMKDCWTFSKMLVERFVAIPAKACKAITPNHLNLGMRWAWIASELCYIGAEHYDVFTINCYSTHPDDALIDGIKDNTGLPVMIGEFHFGALDRGLTGNSLVGVINQHERGVAYQHFFEACAANPNVVGCHYFTLNDQHCMGRFDGENWQIGLLDITQQPYEEMTTACRMTHERMYDVRAGNLARSTQLPVQTERVAL